MRITRRQIEGWVVTDNTEQVYAAIGHTKAAEDLVALLQHCLSSSSGLLRHDEEARELYKLAVGDLDGKTVETIVH